VPYYREQYTNRFHPVYTGVNGVAGNTGSIALESAELMSFRTRLRSDAKVSTLVSDLAADPYAYFLDSTSRRKYSDRLRERNLQPQGDPDRGHPFELKRHTLTGKLHDITRVAGTPATTYNYFGSLVYPVPSGTALNSVHEGTLRAFAPYKETGLDAFAQQAYARTAPTSVVFDAAQFLGELREGLPRLVPSLLRGGSGFFKNAGSDYLNIEFGWKPFIQDIQNAGKALLGATNLLAQQGKRVHRTYSLPETLQADSLSSTGNVTVTVCNPRGFAAGDNSLGPGFTAQTSATLASAYDYAKTRSSRRWFEGEFSSFYPLGFDPNDFLHRLNALVDVRITPSTLWELAPWSWLVDWSLRIEDTIRANEINANDLLIMHYGYAMEHTVYTTNISWRATSGPTGTASWSGLPRSGGYFASTEYKRRLRANPYGFRTGGTGSLTGGQTAILGALGLTKLK
jgi:hypothetical protein